MDIKGFLTLFGGLALFLYGMKMMSDGLEAAAGDRLQLILEKLTSNRIVGVLVGAGITAVIQSSSATTVMVVGFVNAGMMTLKQAVWIIMGANIGTTVTGLLIALDIGAIAPLFAFIGVVLITFIKKEKVQDIGEIIAGLGILFIGMDMMGAAMLPLRESPSFIALMTTVENPLLGILIGLVFTAVIQSSSASIGILQALAASGLIPLHSAAFILFGQNIGTCITAFLASLSANRNAKRTTIVHLLFNVIGTVIFVLLCLATPLISIIGRLTPDNPMAQIANLHILFNVTTTLILLPFGVKLAELAMVILPVHNDEKEDLLKPLYLDDQHLGSVAIATAQLKKEIVHMFEIVRRNVDYIFEALDPKVRFQKEKIERNEAKINALNIEITDFVAKACTLEMSAADSIKINSYFKISNDLERIDDHVMNLKEYMEFYLNKEVDFDEEIQAQLKELYLLLKECLMKLGEESFFDYEDKYELIERDEQKMDDLTFYYREKQVNDLRSKQCSAKTVVTYSEMLTDIERMSDHLLNIAQECNGSRISLKIDD
ncbi:Na/Pi cotransporter family protein [Dielma fastidiosa]|uniref:Na/Pi cotransporter family protein n=3 Tax=Dielma fastidiosa TaxID=1034346 RepID=A0A318KYF2_9FIRM|nr:Na/Pi cotransporter family protein [Dielma fastidiosa]MDY5167298.1 Na/Pi cotransporter family protein [Dielma fastidiosa]PXX78263.1 phosphate:Na+ symporter [Dielma fastidiosa]